MRAPQAQKSYNAASANFADVGNLAGVNAEINASKGLGTDRPQIDQDGWAPKTKLFENKNSSQLRASIKVVELVIWKQCYNLKSENIIIKSF